jgi:hypothetical protein
VGRQGLEPWTYGLKAPRQAEQFPELTAKLGQLLGQSSTAAPLAPPAALAARARVVVAAIEAGDPIAYSLMVPLAGELAAVGGPLASRATVVLVAIEAGDVIAHELMVKLLTAITETPAQDDAK